MKRKVRYEATPERREELNELSSFFRDPPVTAAASAAADPWEAHDIESPTSMSGRFTEAKHALSYIRAGKGTITLRSRATGNRFTYKLTLKENDNPGPRGNPVFVKLLTGSDNNSDYAYLGQFFTGQNVYWHGKKSRIGHDAPGAKAFDWSFQQLSKGHLPEQLEIWHGGCCGRCGRKLTVPESVQSGFGPECVQKVSAIRY